MGLSDIKQGFLDLFRIVFGEDISPELWKWKYFRNPFAVDNPQIVAALDKGKLVGVRPFLLGRMWVKDRKVKVAAACDTMVHPDYRREGIFRRMNDVAIRLFESDGYALFYNTPPSPMAMPGYLKQGWRHVSAVENLFRVTNPRNLISYRLGSKFLGAGLGFLYHLFLGAGKRVPRTKTSFRVDVYDHFSDELKEVDSLRDRSAIELVRSEAYLRWRFDQHPEHQYRYITVKDREELLGYATISTQKEPDNLINNMIIDLVVKENNTDCLRELLSRSLGEFQESQPDLISYWGLVNDDFRTELTEKYGFKSSSDFLYKRFFEEAHFIVRKLNSQALGDVDIFDKGNWRVSRAHWDSM